MINLAIIPARSGSKGLRNKNIKKINNKTLIEIAYDVAKEIKYFFTYPCKHRLYNLQINCRKKRSKVESLRSKSFQKIIPLI